MKDMKTDSMLNIRNGNNWAQVEEVFRMNVLILNSDHNLMNLWKAEMSIKLF